MQLAATTGTLEQVAASGGTLELPEGGGASGEPLGSRTASGGDRGAVAAARGGGRPGSILVDLHPCDGSLSFHTDAPVHPVSLLLLWHVGVLHLGLLHEVSILVPLLNSEIGDNTDIVEVSTFGEMLCFL